MSVGNIDVSKLINDKHLNNHIKSGSVAAIVRPSTSGLVRKVGHNYSEIPSEVEFKIMTTTTVGGGRANAFGGLSYQRRDGGM